MNNGVVHTNGYEHEHQEDDQELEDPYANLDDFYKNHPAARNEPYVAPPDDVEEDDDMPEEYIGDPIRLEDMEPFVKPSLRDDAPLANILHPDLDNIDPR